MSTKKEISKILKNNKLNFVNDPNFIELKKFYEEAKKNGLAKKPIYDLPLIDTIGRKIFLDKNTNNNIIK